MQRPSIGFPIQFNESARYFGLDVVWLDVQGAIQHRFFFSIAPEHLVTDRNLLQRENVARIEINRPPEATQSLGVFSLATLDVTFQFGHPGVIGQVAAGNFQFGQRVAIIEVASIEILRAREMCFARIRTEAKRRLDGGFRQRQTRARMVVAEAVKDVMNPGQLAIRLEKRWVPRDTLVQQISRVPQILFPTIAIGRRQQKVFRAAVEIESGEIGGWWLLNGVFFSG